MLLLALKIYTMERAKAVCINNFIIYNLVRLAHINTN